MKIPSMHSALLAIFLSAVALFPASARAGGEGISGGGNAILCDDGKLYSWDYINSPLSDMPVNPDLLKLKTAREILQYIKQRLPGFDPEKAASLHDFMRFNTSPLDTTTKRLWIKAKNPLVNVGDEFRGEIPKSCVAKAGPNFTVIQAVVRSMPGGPQGKIIYTYDPEVIASLERTSPIQLSFLYIHEWLRDYTSASESLVLADQLLHTKTWPTGIEFPNFLNSIGVQSSAWGKFQTAGAFTFSPAKNGESKSALFGPTVEVSYDFAEVKLNAEGKPAFPAHIKGTFAQSELPVWVDVHQHFINDARDTFIHERIDVKLEFSESGFTEQDNGMTLMLRDQATSLKPQKIFFGTDPQDNCVSIYAFVTVGGVGDGPTKKSSLVYGLPQLNGLVWGESEPEMWVPEAVGIFCR